MTFIEVDIRHRILNVVLHDVYLHFQDQICYCDAFFMLSYLACLREAAALAAPTEVVEPIAEIDTKRVSHVTRKSRNQSSCALEQSFCLHCDSAIKRAVASSMPF